ncbi:MAG: thiamine pyrophosphate-dependent enzyme, partial [Myxococcota bacterium]
MMRSSKDHYAPNAMALDATGISPIEQMALYERMLLPRLIEEKSLKLLRQGKISKWFSGIGQEAVSVGLTHALDRSDVILPLHRNLGVFTTREMPLEKLFAQWQGKAEGFTHGRDRSFHFGSLEHRVVGMISHLGAMLGVADGFALDSLLRDAGEVAAVFSGDGGTSEGDFHEAVNVAAVWDLPVLFVVENNGYGLSTPSGEQYRCARFADKAIGYGIEGIRIDGNDVFEVYRTVQRLADSLRERPRPVLLEAMTFRMRGHEEASGTKYVPDELFSLWRERDPVERLERHLLETGIIDQSVAAGTRHAMNERIQSAWDAVFALAPVEASIERECADVYAVRQDPAVRRGNGATQSLRFVDAVSAALDTAMASDDRLVLMGQDIAEYGGVFKVTDGFVERYGRDRVRNTPLCESAVLGCALGLSLAGRPSVVEMQFADFVSCGFNQIVNNLAKTHYRWGAPVQVTVRLPTGAGSSAGPFHSQSNEAWFTHVPGLKVVYPSTAEDAKGLLLASIRDPNPVMFFEHKGLYRSVQGDVPDADYEIALGRARIAQPGDRLTIVTYGAGVKWALAEAERHGGVEVIDLRSLLPW